MSIYFAGQEYDKMYVGGQEFTQIQIRGQDYIEDTPVDQPGRLSVSVNRVGRDYNFTFSVSDQDGIRSVTSAIFTASDGRTDDGTSDFSRSDANTFAGTDSRRNARWASGTLAVTYVDATSGASHTLRQNWS